MRPYRSSCSRRPLAKCVKKSMCKITKNGRVRSYCRSKKNRTASVRREEKSKTLRSRKIYF